MTSADLLNGGSPFHPERRGTIIPIERTPLANLVADPGTASATVTPPRTTSGEPAIEITDAVECSVGGCDPVQVHSVGTAPLRVTSVELKNSDGEFDVGPECIGTLAPGESCNIEVAFTPSDYGGHTATLVVNQNLPGDPSYVALTGYAGCESAGSTAEYLPTTRAPGDGHCVVTTGSSGSSTSTTRVSTTPTAPPTSSTGVPHNAANGGR